MKSPDRKLFYDKRADLRPIVALFVTLSSFSPKAQQLMSPPLALNLDDCISFALKNQPAVQQAIINEAITDRVIRSKLAAWYPQIGLNYNIQHYLKRPVVTAPLTLGNSYTTNLSITQNIFNSDVLLAAKTSADARLNASQNTALNQIDVVVNVTKSFYDVLVSQQQIDIINQDVLRLQKSVNDTRLQYEAGTVDKTDYKRAVIALNNSLKSRKRLEEQLKSKMSFLKQQMGYLDSVEITLLYDNKKLQQEIMVVPAGPLNYLQRVEFQQLKTQQKILRFNLRYTKWNYLPRVSFFANYNLIGQNNNFSKIYNEAFPNSLVGLTLSLPVFQGTNRLQQTRLAQLELQRLDWDFQNLKLAINAEYTTALAVYEASLNDYVVSNENLLLAREVYKTIQLQYQSGVKTYLDVIIAETDLRSAEVDMLDALYLVLSSRIDVQRAAGTIIY